MYYIEDRAFKWHLTRSILADKPITWEEHKKNCEEEYRRKNSNKKSIKKIKKDNENILLNFMKRKEE